MLLASVFKLWRCLTYRKYGLLVGWFRCGEICRGDRDVVWGWVRQLIIRCVVEFSEVNKFVKLRKVNVTLCLNLIMSQIGECGKRVTDISR